LIVGGTACSLLAMDRRVASLLVILSLLVAAEASAGDGWGDSPPLAPAVKRAADAKRLLLLKVSTAWCPACRRLERVLREPRVKAALSDLLRLAYDAEEGEGKDVAQRYNVVAFPTLLVIGGDGRERGRVTGDPPAAELVAALQKIRDGSGTLARLEQRLAARPDDLALRLQVGTAWAMRGVRRTAMEHLDKVVAADPDNRRGLAAEAQLVRGTFLLLRSLGDHGSAAETLRALRARFPRAPQAKAAIYPLAQALHGLKRTAEALRVLEEGARDADGHDAVAWFCLRHNLALARGLAHARRAVAAAPRRADLWANLATLQAMIGQREQAIASWSRAATLEPDNPRHRRQRELLQRD
jgi:thioredoxin-like negative regulator of GroEL